MRFGLDIAQQRVSFAEVVDRARFAESLGFDGVWGFDHFQPMYGEGPGECFEGYTTLAALSGRTTRVRMGLLVTGATYRPPALLAAEAMTVDHASGGRLELALGASWFEREHRALGIPFPPVGERVDRLVETLEIVRGLLTTDGFTYEGRYHRVVDATVRPRPVQAPHPPIWIGASGDRMLGVVARFADAWHTYGTPAAVTEKGRVVDERAVAAGRDPGAILRAASLSLSQPIADIRRDVDAWRAAGIGYLVAGWPTEGRSRVEEAAAAMELAAG